MAVATYRCGKCSNVFERTGESSGTPDTPLCPECGSTEAQRLPAPSWGGGCCGNEAEYLPRRG